MLNVDRERDVASVELFWQGGARTELPVRLKHTTVKRSGTRPELIDLVRKLAQHSSDPEIAMVLSKQGWSSPTGLPFTAARVRGIRERANIAAAPSTEPVDSGVSILEAARELGSARRRSVAGFLKGCYRPSRQPSMRRGGSGSPTRSDSALCRPSRTGPPASACGC